MATEHTSYLRRLVDSGQILIASPDMAFDRNYQINPDGINLRLHPYAYRVQPPTNENQCINILERYDNNNALAEPVEINIKGFRLRPNDVLLGRTLETVSIESDKLIGLVFGRATLASFGLSITFNQSKFPPFYPWSFPLQIKNNLNCDVMVYPYIYIAQLLVLEYPLDETRGAQFAPLQGNPFMNVSGAERDKVDESIELHRRHKLVAANVNSEDAALAEIRRQREKFAQEAEARRREQERLNEAQRVHEQQLVEAERALAATEAEKQRQKALKDAEERAERIAATFRYPFSGILHLFATGLVAVALPLAAVDFKAGEYDAMYIYGALTIAAVALEYSHFLFRRPRKPRQ